MRVGLNWLPDLSPWHSLDSAGACLPCWHAQPPRTCRPPPPGRSVVTSEPPRTPADPGRAPSVASVPCSQRSFPGPSKHSRCRLAVDRPRGAGPAGQLGLGGRDPPMPPRALVWRRGLPGAPGWPRDSQWHARLPLHLRPSGPRGQLSAFAPSYTRAEVQGSHVAGPGSRSTRRAALEWGVRGRRQHLLPEACPSSKPAPRPSQSQRRGQQQWSSQHRRPSVRKQDGD